MTVCAIETTANGVRTTGPRGWALAADGSHAARLSAAGPGAAPAVGGTAAGGTAGTAGTTGATAAAGDAGAAGETGGGTGGSGGGEGGGDTGPPGDTGPAGGTRPGLCVERWALHGPEPYLVTLPVRHPEPAGSAVQPLADGRVLVVRPGDGHHRLALLHPTGPGTGELLLGGVESDRLTLLPPAPDGRSAYVLAPGFETTAIWLVTGGPAGAGPQPVAEVPGHCVDGHWLDRAGRLLALNRRDADGRTTAVVVDLARGGEVTPLLQIGDRSNDRLLLADPDSGLLLVSSDAPGEMRTGWGVLGSERPVRFPEALHQRDVALTPFAVQPGQVLTPEHATLAFTAAGPNGTWVALWRPGQRTLRHHAAPRGWLTHSGLLTPGGHLLLPYTGPAAGLATVPPEAGGAPPPGPAEAAADRPAAAPTAGRPPHAGRPAEAPAPPVHPRTTGADAPTVRGTASAQPICRPVPLQQAPLHRAPATAGAGV